MLTKSVVIDTLKKFPEQFSLDELVEELAFLQKVKQGLQESIEGKTVSTEEAKKRLSKWLR